MLIDVLAIKFTNWSNVLLKLSRFKGKLFEIRLPNSQSRLSEKASGQKFFLFLKIEIGNFLPSFSILLILHMITK